MISTRPYFWSLILALFISGSAYGSPDTVVKIHWAKSFKKTLQKAKKEKRLTLAYFYSNL